QENKSESREESLANNPNNPTAGTSSSCLILDEIKLIMNQDKEQRQHEQKRHLEKEILKNRILHRRLEISTLTSRNELFMNYVRKLLPLISTFSDKVSLK